MFSIRMVSLKNGNALRGGALQIPAPRRDFEEAPTVEVQGNMIAIVAGTLFSDAANPDRAVHVALVDITTGLPQFVGLITHRRCQSDDAHRLVILAYSSLPKRTRVQLGELHILLGVIIPAGREARYLFRA